MSIVYYITGDEWLAGTLLECFYGTKRTYRCFVTGSTLNLTEMIKIFTNNNAESGLFKLNIFKLLNQEVKSCIHQSHQYKTYFQLC